MAMLSIFVAFAAQVAPIVLPPQQLVRGEVPRIRERVGTTPFENHTLSQPHRNMDDRMFPDIAVKDMRIDGDTLYVLVKNQGGSSARGPIRVVARAEANGVRSDARPARLSMLGPGESRWVPLEHFKVALADASRVSVTAVAAPPPALDRSGQDCNQCTDLNEENNGLSAPSAAIGRGRPQ
jgi:hypothetical protein